ncbi:MULTISPECIES: amidohydrolase family protein [Pandoraea]|uniref:amidohydrolase family protein n=1 Tax=Pandoraea TaxID=93217 RepID=UPI001F5C77BE|nr:MULTISPECIES: amidohydrolase family protein [Pandoraea]MCI3205913.1 amidohydrolase [Pandoraea sp. LA3]MDN4583941.1 amidohydrolase [Pandoraea capi]
MTHPTNAVTGGHTSHLQRVIDMRCRPAYLHDFFGKTPGSPGEATARWLNRRVGTRGDDAHFTRSRTPEGFLEVVRDAAHTHGLTHAVVVGRHTPGQHLPNDTIHDIVHAHPELIGIGAVDPVLQGEAAALAEIERVVGELGLAGIDIEPGFGEPARHPDDPVYFPVYELAQTLDVPVFLMSGPTTPDLRFNDPAPLARVAQAFPKLRIVAYHGYWPNVQQMVGVAFRYDNVFVVPDMYLFQPGSQAYVDAANGFLGDQLLFGSSYPFRPIAQSIDDLLALGLRESVIDKVLYANAAQLLGV